MKVRKQPEQSPLAGGSLTSAILGTNHRKGVLLIVTDPRRADPVSAGRSSRTTTIHLTVASPPGRRALRDLARGRSVAETTGAGVGGTRIADPESDTTTR